MHASTVKAFETSLAKGRASFIVVIDVVTDNGTTEERVSILPQSLTDYASFQNELLIQGFGLYRHAACEGRAPEVANENWRSFVSVALNPPKCPVSSSNPSAKSLN